MPEQRSNPALAQKSTPEKGQTASPDAEMKPQGQKKPEGKKTPAQKKDEGLKYEMTYVNGGFNNGCQIKPDKDGKALIEISIYGGGTKKTLSVGPLPGEIAKLIKAYEVSTTQGQETPEITGELQKYFEQLNTTLSQKIIQILTEADAKVERAIRETFKSN